ncbi:MAG: polysaccharide lyase [Dongiaceae bacterium]
MLFRVMTLSAVLSLGLIPFPHDLQVAAEESQGFTAIDEEAYVPDGQQAPCSERYARRTPLGIADIGSGRSVSDGLKKMRASDLWGIDENVRIDTRNGKHPVVIEVTYPEGSYAPGADDAPRGGAGFHAEFPNAPDVETACLRYAVRFPAGFDFVKGGKLPGLYGGTPPSGGGDVTGQNGFSTRFMWREDGQGEVYAYIVNKPEDYGTSIGRGAWQFPTDQWIVLEQEVLLNDPGTANGVLNVWVDGRQTIEQTDIVYRTTDSLSIDGLMFSTFFGGGDESWATPKDQTIEFADFEFFLPEQ